MFRVSGNQISITAGDTALMAICPDETLGTCRRQRPGDFHRQGAAETARAD